MSTHVTSAEKTDHLLGLDLLTFSTSLNLKEVRPNISGLLLQNLCIFMKKKDIIWLEIAHKDATCL